MSFQVGIGSLGGTVFFQVGLCIPLRTMLCCLVSCCLVLCRVASCCVVLLRVSFSRLDRYLEVALLTSRVL